MLRYYLSTRRYHLSLYVFGHVDVPVPVDVGLEDELVYGSLEALVVPVVLGVPV